MAAVAELFDMRLRTQEDFEKKLGEAVIGVIPRDLESERLAHGQADPRLPLCLRSPALLVLCLIAFTIPMGAWQERMLLGLTVPKILVPALAIGIALRGGRLYPYTLLLFAFFLSYLPSFFRTDYPFAGVLATLGGYLILCNIVFSVVRMPSDVDRLLKAFLAGVALVTACSMAAAALKIDVGRMLGTPMVQDVFGLKRLVGTEENPNAFGVFYAVGLPCAFHYFLTQRGLRTRAALLALLGAMALCLFMTASRSSMLGALTGCGALLFFRLRRAASRMLFLGLVPLAALAAYFLPALTVQYVTLARTGSGDPQALLADKSLAVAHRIEMLGPLGEILLDNPVVGVGFANLGPELAKRGYVHATSAHNIFISLAVEIGLVTLGLFVWVLFLTIRDLWISIETDPDPYSRHLGVAVQAMLCSMLACSLFHDTLMHVLLWLLIALGPVCRRMSGRRDWGELAA